MKQYQIRTENLDQSSPNDAHLNPSDPIHELKIVQYLAGLNATERLHEYRLKTEQARKEEQRADQGSNISVTGTEKARIQREKNIRPGTPEWFRLWFTLPYLTNTKPTDK